MMLKNKFSSALICMLLFGLVGCKYFNRKTLSENKESDFFYDINVDSLEIQKEEIQRNAFLADILLGYNLDYSTIQQITEYSKGIFDFRKLKVGQNYYVLQRNDSLRTPEYFIYDVNMAEYIVCDFRNSVCVYSGKKPVRTEERIASGEIESSLYMTLDNNNLHPTLALSLSDIFAWTIDFYHLQKGDKFKVIYEEQFVDTMSLGVTYIKAAIFNHMGKDIYAARFKVEGDSTFSYFDMDGESLRRAFLKSPLKFGRISSKYSMSRKHPVTGITKAHKGTDFAAPTGTPILATGNGVILEAKFSKYNGNYVKIKHNATYMTQYLHMSKIASGMKPGKQVKQGDVIGYVGSTGLATGPHVCYRFWKSGDQVDPTKEKLLFSNPIPSKELPKFRIIADSVKVLLDNIKYPDNNISVQSKVKTNQSDE